MKTTLMRELHVKHVQFYCLMESKTLGAEWGRQAKGGTIPEAMWFCFFSSSVRRGFSSAPATPFSRDDGEVLFGDDMAGCVCVVGVK